MSSTAQILVPQNAGSGYSTQNSYLDRFDSWLFARGGASVEVTNLTLTLTGGPGTTIIQGICAHVISRTKVLSGTLFYKAPQGGSGAIGTTLNLDSDEPCAKYFSGHYITLSKGETSMVDISAAAHSDTVTWNLSLDAVVNGTQQFIPVQSREALRTTGLLPELTGYGAYYTDQQTDNYVEEFRAAVPGPSDEKNVESLAR
jgi:hypothetical protein